MLKINKNNSNLLDTYLTERVVISSKPISNKLYEVKTWLRQLINCILIMFFLIKKRRIKYESKKQNNISI